LYWRTPAHIDPAVCPNSSQAAAQVAVLVRVGRSLWRMRSLRQLSG